ncbi:hypothetical protein AC249_AIPGENE4192 [Exaiptasia diaphana]|nr:hypothetical protein AC249_AIPGENE4192 [Exaiptasia diaphana]
MNSYLKQVVKQLPKVYKDSEFNGGDLFVILQGLTAFADSSVQGNPVAAVNAAIDIAAHFATKCNTGTLQENLENIKTWLKFGEEYKVLKDSNDLDFDKVNVGSVPEVMQANLEMNKEGLTADLVCMIEERSLPRNVASFKKTIEQFFIAGSARIDLIAKVIDLDNQIGGYNFDIPNLEETVSELDELSSIGETPIADNIQESFLDNLLTSYQNIESSFSQHLYNFYKSYEFFTLWNVTSRLTAFERTASEAASGNGQLQGAVILTKAFQEINDINFKEKQCFAKFSPKIDRHKWSFNSTDNSMLFTDLHKGMANVALKMFNISDSSEPFYNIRLYKMYIELYGEGDITKKINNLPAMVRLKVQRQSASYFKDGAGHAREFRQSLTDWRKFDFNRFGITDENKCNKAFLQGIGDSLYCLNEDDHRLKIMSCRQGRNLKCEDGVGAPEWPSPFGTYTLSLPIDDKLECKSTTRVSTKNCKDFDDKLTDLGRIG